MPVGNAAPFTIAHRITSKSGIAPIPPPSLAVAYSCSRAHTQPTVGGVAAPDSSRCRLVRPSEREHAAGSEQAAAAN
eukprot:COSAG06_NODE_24732_length_654_cov_0.684685_1_plen_76_part_01